MMMRNSSLLFYLFALACNFAAAASARAESESKATGSGEEAAFCDAASIVLESVFETCASDIFFEDEKEGCVDWKSFVKSKGSAFVWFVDTRSDLHEDQNAWLEQIKSFIRSESAKAVDNRNPSSAAERTTRWGMVDLARNPSLYRKYGKNFGMRRIDGLPDGETILASWKFENNFPDYALRLEFAFGYRQPFQQKVRLPVNERSGKRRFKFAFPESFAKKYTLNETDGTGDIIRSIGNLANMYAIMRSSEHGNENLFSVDERIREIEDRYTKSAADSFHRLAKSSLGGFAGYLSSDPLDIPELSKVLAGEKEEISLMWSRMNDSKLEAIEALKSMTDEEVTELNEVASALSTMLSEDVPHGLQEILENEGESLGDSMNLLPMPRRSALSFSVTEFIEEFAMKGRPVVITDTDMIPRDVWADGGGLESFCGDGRSYFHGKQEDGDREESGANWGSLKIIEEQMTVREFLATYRTNETRRKYYLFDSSMDGLCDRDSLARHIRIPKYFAGEWLRRIPPTVLSQEIWSQNNHWPSLFLGSGDTESGIHVDNFNSNFLMYLVEGKKHWKVFERSGATNVYLYRYFMSDFGLPGKPPLDVFRLNTTMYPLAARARGWEVIQKPGDLVYIPGGSPHAVQNKEAIFGVSMNYLDATNFGELAMFVINGNPNLLPVMDLLSTRSPAFPQGVDPDQADLMYGDYLKMPWHLSPYREKLTLNALRHPRVPCGSDGSDNEAAQQQ